MLINSYNDKRDACLSWRNIIWYQHKQYAKSTYVSNINYTALLLLSVSVTTRKIICNINQAGTKRKLDKSFHTFVVFNRFAFYLQAGDRKK